LFTASDYRWGYVSADKNQDSSQACDANASFWRTTAKFLTYKPVYSAIKFASIYLYPGSAAVMVIYGTASSVVKGGVFYANDFAWYVYVWSPASARLLQGNVAATEPRQHASSNDPDWMPDELRSLPPLGRSRGAAMAWRLATPVAQPGWFMAGNAAAVLDPTSSGGVLKAIMSGMMAAHRGAPVIAGSVPADAAAEANGNWVADWFAPDATRLAPFYRGLGVAGFGRRSHPARPTRG
jgi:hypothetical protein